MAKRELADVRVAILAADGFEQVELTRPRRALLEHGAEVEIISLRPGSIRGMHLLIPGIKVKVDRTILTADPNDYDGVLIPGGFVNPDFLRQSERVLQFVREFDRSGRPIATLCHGPWVLISAGLVRGRRLASWPGIQDDTRNAGGIWEDRAVVVDGNWVSSRSPMDLLQFNRAIIEHFDPNATARERRFSVPVGPAVVGGLALAAVGYGLRRRDHNQSREGGGEHQATPSEHQSEIPADRDLATS
jgi:protease I